MSELKAVHAFDVYDSYTKTGDDDAAKVYIKSEADKVIAELEESHKKEVEQLLILNREQANAANRLRDNMEQTLRHNKYKRCLAMAGRCFTKSNYHFVLARHGEDAKENNRKSILYTRWRKCWLAIAENFKTNSTKEEVK